VRRQSNSHRAHKQALNPTQAAITDHQKLGVTSLGTEHGDREAGDDPLLDLEAGDLLLGDRSSACDRLLWERCSRTSR
jgi:hypothetical protein